MNGPAAVLTSLAELDVVPPFDKPWMATSLADFWGRYALLGHAEPPVAAAAVRVVHCWACCHCCASLQLGTTMQHIAVHPVNTHGRYGPLQLYVGTSCCSGLAILASDHLCCAVQCSVRRDKVIHIQTCCAVLCRRWNNTVSLTLRSLIYDPIVEGCWIHKGPAMPAGPAATAAAAPAGADASDSPTSSGFAGSTDSDSSDTDSAQQTAANNKVAIVDSSNTPTTSSSGVKSGSAGSKGVQKPPRVPLAKKLAGTAATFAVSGLMHEFILLYALHEDNSYPAGFWFMFFFCQVGLKARDVDAHSAQVSILLAGAVLFALQGCKQCVILAVNSSSGLR